MSTMLIKSATAPETQRDRSGKKLPPLTFFSPAYFPSHRPLPIPKLCPSRSKLIYLSDSGYLTCIKPQSSEPTPPLGSHLLPSRAWTTSTLSSPGSARPCPPGSSSPSRPTRRTASSSSSCSLPRRSRSWPSWRRARPRAARRAGAGGATRFCWSARAGRARRRCLSSWRAGTSPRDTSRPCRRTREPLT
jgi:hypothetical protein